VINPVIIILEKYGSTAWIKIIGNWYHFGYAFLVDPHELEVIVIFFDDMFSFTL
jgi:hypothetical protein